jgi:hypothetical protein
MREDRLLSKNGRKAHKSTGGRIWMVMCCVAYYSIVKKKHETVSELKRKVFGDSFREKTQASKEHNTKAERTESRTSTIGHQRAPP